MYNTKIYSFSKERAPFSSLGLINAFEMFASFSYICLLTNTTESLEQGTVLVQLWRVPAAVEGMAGKEETLKRSQRSLVTKSLVGVMGIIRKK